MLVPYFLFFAGLIFIIKGGDLFVDGATWMAKVTGLPEVLIGATIVSLATTLPETTVSAISAIQNESGMALGNAIGSIICNTGLILGLSNFIKPSKINSKSFCSKGILLLVYLIFLLLICSKGSIQGTSSLIIFAMLILYIIFNIKETYTNKNCSKEKTKSTFFTKKEAIEQITSFILGAVFVLIGANLLVDYGVVIARYWGVPSAIISLTLISLGTSLPEFITAISALIKGHTALSLGNILGANILNITLAIGVSSLFNPLPIDPQTITIDIPVALILNTILVIPSIFTKKTTRSQAACILLGYLIYIGFLFVFH
ncbi:calcium/sodium antiporter [Garciella nitratireducens]|uniref:calcium/sodium antiporter n=1 Tax=Garciella nitratireducens TaxID=218205 RepID=UPI000DFCAE12|nr:calcium/sodium antiporter [Garciella nitratireducens]RBP43967.1 cation:H+ antiporter [Garciella nitratireducens]